MMSPFSGALVAGAKEGDLAVVSMQNDWRRIFAWQDWRFMESSAWLPRCAHIRRDALQPNSGQIICALFLDVQQEIDMSIDESGPRGHTATSNVVPNPVTAIDVVLEPDVLMIQHAETANAGLLENFPKGYSLDAEHRPHISVVGAYVYTANLDKIYAAAARVLATEKILSWKMTAFKYYYIPLKEIGLGGIVVEPTPDMIRLQKKLIDTLAPFMAPNGTAAAYATTPSNPDINQGTLDAVATYLAEHTGENYSPHVTIGVGTVGYLDKLLAAPFPSFTFSAIGMSVYQFGNFGTAAKRLHAFRLTQ
jgi:hypothetical protein